MSGLDTESMVRQIMQAESGRLHRMQRNRTRLQWRQETYQDVASQLRSFHSRFLDLSSPTSLRMQRTWGNFNTTVNGASGSSNAVTVTPGAGASSGSHRLEVLQRAQRETFTGNAANLKSSISSRADVDFTRINSMISNKLTDIDNRIAADANLDRAQLEEEAIILDFNLNLNGSTRRITLSIADIRNEFNIPAGDNAPASFAIGDSRLTTLMQNKADDAFGAGRINVTGGGNRLNFTPDGNGHTLTITEGRALTATTASGNIPSFMDFGPSNDAFNEAAFVEHFLGPTGGPAPSGPFSLVVNGETIDVDFTGVTRHSGAILNRINDTLSSNGHFAAFTLDRNAGEVRLSTTGVTREDINISGGTIMGTFGLGSTTLQRTSSLALMGMENNDRNTFSTADNIQSTLPGIPPALWTPVLDSDGNPEVDENGVPTGRERFDMVINGTTITLFSDDTMNDLATRINGANAGVTFNYNSFSRTFTLESNREGENNAINFGSNSEVFFDALGMNRTQVAQDSRFILNGVETTRETNTFTHDYVTFTFNEGAVAAGEITIGVTRDNSATINLIRDFVTAYNELRTNLNDMIHERRARSMGSFFEPLTDEERRAMSDDEVRRWEEQARTGLMHRNDLLTRMVNDMRSQLFNGVELPDGTRLSLSQIGINPSSNHADRGTLVIDEERLAAAIEQHGERIGQMFTTSGGIGERMHNIIEDATHVTRGTISRRAGGTSATDPNNELLRQLTREDERIANVTRQLARREEALFRMFSRMEVSLMQSDSQMNFMMQMFMQ